MSLDFSHAEQRPRFLKHLRLVAVDELHYYSGTIGRSDPHIALLPAHPLTLVIAMSHRS